MSRQKRLCISKSEWRKSSNARVVNLRELCLVFREYTSEQIGFSKFCELRPKWCLPVSSSGMHSVCVCELHQNVKLLVDVIPIQADYKDLLQRLVCNTDDRKCMIHLCDSCSGKEGLQAYLNEVFEQNNYDVDDVIVMNMLTDWLLSAHSV